MESERCLVAVGDKIQIIKDTTRHALKLGSHHIVRAATRHGKSVEVDSNRTLSPDDWQLVD